MPYKYVVAVDSKGFDEAPPVIMNALSRLTWATRQVVANAEGAALLPNELLLLGYFEEMAIGVSSRYPFLFFPFSPILNLRILIASSITMTGNPLSDRRSLLCPLEERRPWKFAWKTNTSEAVASQISLLLMTPFWWAVASTNSERPLRMNLTTGQLRQRNTTSVVPKFAVL
jgi:hypothetical protein